MQRSLKSAAFVLASLSFACASAQQIPPGLYAGANFSLIDYNETGLPTYDPTALGLKLGSQISRNIAIEGRLGIPMSSGTVYIGGVPDSVDIGYFGVYGKGMIPLSPSFTLYGLLGLTRGKATYSQNSIAYATNSTSSVSYGVGGEFWLSRNVALNVEWARLFRSSFYGANALSFGVDFHF
jgi:OOP family OmpA-OmpF porin